jgi:hypothetical protein
VPDISPEIAMLKNYDNGKIDREKPLLTKM